MPKQDKANTTNVFRDKNSRRGKAAAADKSETDFQYNTKDKRRVIIRKRYFREKIIPGQKVNLKATTMRFYRAIIKAQKTKAVFHINTSK